MMHALRMNSVAMLCWDMYQLCECYMCVVCKWYSYGVHVCGICVVCLWGLCGPVFPDSAGFSFPLCSPVCQLYMGGLTYFSICWLLYSLSPSCSSFFSRFPFLFPHCFWCNKKRCLPVMIMLTE